MSWGWVATIEERRMVAASRLPVNAASGRALRKGNRLRGQGAGSIFRRQMDLFLFADKRRIFVPARLEPEETATSVNGYMQGS